MARRSLSCAVLVGRRRQQAQSNRRQDLAPLHRVLKPVNPPGALADNSASVLDVFTQHVLPAKSLVAGERVFNERPENPIIAEQAAEPRTAAQRRRWALALPFHDAQIAEREYCRPHARPFRLGFPRKAPVFPVCSPAAL